MSEPRDHLDVAYVAKAQVRPLLGLAAFLLAYVVLAVLGTIPVWLAVAGGLVVAVIIAVGLVQARRSHGSPSVLRLDADGVTVAGAPLVPWSALRQVLITPMRPVWLVGSRSTTVLALLPRDGVELSGPPHPRGRPYEWGRRQRLRQYGTNLVLFPSAMSASAADIAAAAQRWGGLPVEQVPFRPLRKWGLMLGASVALGVVGGLLAVAFLGGR